MVLRPRRVVSLSGATASGKSTLARHLHQEFGFAVVGFGAFVRSRARGRDKPDRERLQELGAALLYELGPDELVAATVNHAAVPPGSRALVFDGVRHREVALAISRRFQDAETLAVFLAVSAGVRQERLAAQGASADLMAQWDEHETEAQLPQLEAAADLVLADATIETAAARILNRFSGQSGPA